MDTERARHLDQAIAGQAIAGRTFGKLDLNLTVNNLLNSDWREAQFAEMSAVMPGGPAVAQMHFTPGIPLTATATAAYRF